MQLLGGLILALAIAPARAHVEGGQRLLYSLAFVIARRRSADARLAGQGLSLELWLAVEG